MAQPDQEAKPVFSHPIRQLTLMLIVLALSGVGAVFALPTVMPVFLANPFLNGVILAVFFIGVIACFYQVFQLVGSVRWIESFVSGDSDGAASVPQLLAPLAALLRTRGSRMQINATSSRSILDSVATRIDEAREITRYIVNMLIFLGLLGTFYGLATTVPAVVDTIRNLAPQDGDGSVDVFNRLMIGLEAQLGGMGVAFSSSLLGLAGSLIVGLLELFAGQSQNRFYQELEDWLSTITRVGFHTGEDSPGEASAMDGVINHMVDQMDSLAQMVTENDIGRSKLEGRLGLLTDAVGRLATKLEEQPDAAPPGDALDRIATGQDRIATGQDRIATGQERMIALMELNDKTDQREAVDAESRMRLRSIDVQMLRILEEISAGREEVMAEMREDIGKLAQALSQPRGQSRLPRVDGQADGYKDIS